MGTGQGAAAVLFGREGNRRSGVELAMRHRLSNTDRSRPMRTGVPVRSSLLLPGTNRNVVPGPQIWPASIPESLNK